MSELRIIIAGCRDFNDYSFLEKECLRIIKQTVGKISKNDVTIVSGRATGADRLGERFAEKFGLKVKYFPADWDRFGRRAGPMRNAEMASYASGSGDKPNDEVKGMLIAFWDGESRGTKNMIDTARKMQLAVHVVDISPMRKEMNR